MEYDGNPGAISENLRQLKTMSMTDKVDSIQEAIEDAEKVVYAFHKFRNETEEEEWEKYEGTPLGDLLDCMMDLECSMDMENDEIES